MSKGTVPVTGTITPTSDLDTYATHWDKYARGGHRTVANIAQRDAITTDRRSEGMQVYVRDIRQLQQLIGGTDNTKWVTLLTIDVDNKVIVNNDLNLQKYIIAGSATTMLPNAVALGGQTDGYLISTAGNLSTTTSFDPAGITLSSGKLLIGSGSNKAVETQTVNINNLPTGDLTGGGMIKYDSVSSLLKIATPDTDYATVVTLNKIAAAAAASASDAAHSATACAADAAAAAVSASAALTSATLANGYAESAGGSATEAIAAGVVATAGADAAEAEAFDAAISATNANDRKVEAAASAKAAATSEANSLAYYNNLISLGISGLKNYGNVDFNGFRGISVAPGSDPFDIATVSQITAIGGSYVKSVTGTTGNITSTGGQTPVLDLAAVGTAGTSNLANITTDGFGRVTTRTSTTFFGVAGRTSVTGTGTTNMIVDLVNTGITAKAYTLANLTLGLDGRATAATSNTLAGTSGRITLSAFPNAVIDLAVATSAGSTALGQYQAWDTYGRTTVYEPIYFHSTTSTTTPTNTVTTTAGTYYTANLPVGSVISAAGFSWLGGTAGVTANMTFGLKKSVTCIIGINHNGAVTESFQIRMVKNVLTTPVYYTFVDVFIGYGQAITLEALMDIASTDTINLQYKSAVNGRTMITNSCAWIIK